jgi:mitotic spindle assembly checkpoint protein MAD1
VLHLKMNPEAEAVGSAADKELSALRAENRSLKGSLTQLEQSMTPGGVSDDPTSSAQGATALAVAEAQATVLKQRVADLAKRESRYKEIFKDKIKTFRDACYYLFGYKVEMKDAPDGATMFILRSMFTGEGDSERLMFKYTAKGEPPLTLEDTAYTMQDSEVKKQVDTFVRRFRSIPGFTANLTMEQFNKHTLC